MKRDRCVDHPDTVLRRLSPPISYRLAEERAVVIGIPPSFSFTMVSWGWILTHARSAAAQIQREMMVVSVPSILRAAATEQ